MTKIGLDSAEVGLGHRWNNLDVQKAIQAEIGGSGFPTVIRPSFTLGGTGGGIAYNPEEFETICKRGLDLSPTNELLIEEALLGWKEYEMEVVRDKADNCIIVCSIENLDPMGVHTGDSITVAPAQTCSDKNTRSCATPRSPCCARSVWTRAAPTCSSRSTRRRSADRDRDEPARVAFVRAGLQGHGLPDRQGQPSWPWATRDELKNEITGGATPASFEPSIDYVVTKIPRFAFEKIPDGRRA